MANRFPTVLRASGMRVLLKGAATILILLSLGWLANSIDFEETFKSFNFTDTAMPWWRGPIGFFGFCCLMILIGCPRQVVSFFCAYFFGLMTGTAMALAATIIGCVVTLTIARQFQRFFLEMVRGRLKLALDFWRSNTFFATLIWRFLPIGSNQMTNIAAGALNIPPGRFVLGSALGYIPQTFVFAMMGSGVELESSARIAVSVALFAISALLGLWLYSKYRNQLKEPN